MHSGVKHVDSRSEYKIFLYSLVPFRWYFVPKLKIQRASFWRVLWAWHWCTWNMKRVRSPPWDLLNFRIWVKTLSLTTILQSHDPGPKKHPALHFFSARDNSLLFYHTWWWESAEILFVWQPLPCVTAISDQGKNWRQLMIRDKDCYLELFTRP